MKHITFYLDFISPFAYLAFEKLPQVLMGLSYSVSYKPVFLGAILKHHGSLGPAEIPAKRDWTYRQVLWLAHEQGTPLQMPAAHPFNPLALLRLAVACDDQGQGQPNRYVCETIFRHVWTGGDDPVDAARLLELTQRLNPGKAPGADEVKAQLRAHSDQAMALGCFGVPALEVDGKLFWGLDALTMLRSYLEGGDWFKSPDWDQAPQTPSGFLRA